MSKRHRKTKKMAAMPSSAASSVRGSDPSARGGLRISPSAVGSTEYVDFSAGATHRMTPAQVRQTFGPAATLGAPEAVQMACDSQLEASGVYSLMQHTLNLGAMPPTQFMGYGALQNIAQHGMVRACIETVADDMTREWIEVSRQGEVEKTPEQQEEADYLASMGIPPENDDTPEQDDAIATLQAAIEKYELQRVFHEACTMVGYEGGAMVFIDTGKKDKLHEPLNISEASAELTGAGQLRFIAVDPINVFPGQYNSTNPLSDDYFRPKTWWVLGTEVHESRLLRLVANEVPVLLKPAYNFFGIPQAQILWDYVMHFSETRTASQRLLTKFSLTVFKTEFQNTIMQAGGVDELDKRVQMLVKYRSNDGVQVIDKEVEDIVKLETPITGVVDIVRQSLEILAAMNRTPAVKLLGISPSGFNATGESDIRNYYDHIKSQQSKVLRTALSTVLQVLQVKELGKIDNALTFDFKALGEADRSAEANTRKVLADTDVALINAGVISAEEARQRLADDPESGYSTIDVDNVPEQQNEAEEPDMGFGGGEEEAQPEVVVQDERRWVTSKGGKHFEVDDETGEITKGNVGQKGAHYTPTPLETTKPDMAQYNELLQKHDGNAKKAAHEYFKENMQGRYLSREVEDENGKPFTADICFTGGGWIEIKKSMTPEKAACVPHIPSVLQDGEYKRDTQTHTHPDVQAVHSFSKQIETTTGKQDVLVDVMERVTSIPKHSVYSLSHEGAHEYNYRKEKESTDSSLLSSGPGAAEAAPIRIMSKGIGRLDTTDSSLLSSGPRGIIKCPNQIMSKGIGRLDTTDSIRVSSGPRGIIKCPNQIMMDEIGRLEDNISPTFELVNIRFAGEEEQQNA